MTLHTRVMVTSPGVDPAKAFVKLRELIGAGEQYTAWTSPDPNSESEYRRTMNPGFHMDIAQGLPALAWVEFAAPGTTLGGPSHDDWCEEDCSGKYHDPVGYIEINYDTAYGYRADNDASCSDLHAYITREIGSWLNERGATWKWFDECGDGWRDDLSSYGALGHPEVGRLGSTIPRREHDAMRAFGEAALDAIAAEVSA